jgi:YfiH family protein
VTSPLSEYAIAGRSVRIVATDRSDGDVHPERVPATVLAQRQRRATGRPWVMLDEVHGVDVVDASSADAEFPMAGRGDVVVTRDADLDLAVWTADCAPIFLLADDGTTVGIHAGWRGLAGGVVDVGVAAACRDGGRVAAAVLGPAIGPCCYEFGADDLERVARGVHARPAEVSGTTTGGHLALDVPAAVRAALGDHGLGLDVVGPCTGCDDRWFSHRVRADPERHATVATISAVSS